MSITEADYAAMKAERDRWKAETKNMRQLEQAIVADTIAACLHEEAKDVWDSAEKLATVESIVQRIALEFSLDNPRFNEGRFRSAIFGD